MPGIQEPYGELLARFLPAWEFLASPRKAFGLIPPAPAVRAPRASPPAQEGSESTRPGLAATRGFRARGAHGVPV
jgi:hypothetical protein